MGLSQDTYFNTRVTKATWDEGASVWRVEAESKEGKQNFTASFLVSCLGFASAPMNPFDGAETFKGQIFHTGNWDESVKPEDLRGKRIGVVGTGASGVQVSQELGKVASEFKLFQRTPNLCLPMGQAQLTPQAQEAFKDCYEDILEKRRCVGSIARPPACSSRLSLADPPAFTPAARPSRASTTTST